MYFFSISNMVVSYDTNFVSISVVATIVIVILNDIENNNNVNDKK